ncbi:MAG: nucleotidyltransferase family protein [Chloroflexi bacterium]|nr:nucleotidyltransferase family protein [Chloroflexota bacterium]
MKAKTIPTIAEVKEKVLPILERHHAKRAGLFGSVMRGEMRRNSDIDILVELGKDLSLLDVVQINRELEEALGSKVDLVEYETIKPVIRERILAEEVRIL